jgi:NAD(P)-dependent dehydrogenase (short-subunit alcohol dehydrogenase family)
LKGHFACIRAAIPAMKVNGYGRIVTITSTVGLYGLATSAGYAAAKAGIVGLTKSAALEVEPYGITVNCIAPSAVSRMSAGVPIAELERRAVARGKAPLPVEMPEDEKRRRLVGDPAAIANLISYLGGMDAAGITGQVFFVFGGHIGVYGAYTEVAQLDRTDGVWNADDLVTAVPEMLVPKMPDVTGWWGRPQKARETERVPS